MTTLQTIRRAPSRLQRLWRESASDSALHWAMYQAWRERLPELGVPCIRGLRTLDIGCGNRCPLSLLFAADGAIVTGLDLEPIALGWSRPVMWLRLLKRFRVRSAAKAVTRDALHTWRYWQNLARLARRRLPFRDISLVTADASHLPFPDGSFDLVVSSAVWEHLTDVEAATREVHRVLAPGGVAIIQIALFPALQGGHHPEWHSVDQTAADRVRPWDHLRPGRLPFPIFLNEWREDQYRAVVPRYLDVVAWEDGDMRGEGFLTEPLAGELRDYTRRDLLLSGVTVFARRAEIADSAPGSAPARPRVSPARGNV